jgi:hypoxanthine phosphoribosyltransferase
VTSPAPSEESRRRHPSFVVSESASFAHPSERTFASLLSLYGHEWIYEPIEFPLAWNSVGQPTRGFRPDFFLPERHLFIEMTVLDQRLVTKKNQKIRQFRELYPEVELIVVYQRDYNELIARHGLHVISRDAA